MKKPVFSTVLAILFSCAIYAQDEPAPEKEVKKFRFGLNGSPIISWIKPDAKGINNDGIKIGFNYGLMTDFVLSGNGNYSFSTGLKIANLNGALKYADYTNFGTVDDHSTTTDKMHVRYIEVPVTLKMRTNEIGYMTYYGQFGVDLGANIKAKKNFTTTSASNNTLNITEEDVDINEEIGLFRAALHLGLGGEYNLSGNTSLLFGVTFSNGFTNVFGGKAGNYFELDNSGKVDDTIIHYNPAKSQWEPDKGIKKKAITNYVALNLGIFF